MPGSPDRALDLARVLLSPALRRDSTVARVAKWLEVVSRVGPALALGQDVVDVTLDRVAADHQGLCDLAVAPASGDQANNLDLAC